MPRLVLVLLLVSACRTSSSGSANPNGEPADAKGTPSTAGGGPGTAAPAERCPGGILWNGTPTACAYEVDGCCYADAETACSVSKCEPSKCEVLETYPAQVRCTTP